MSIADGSKYDRSLPQRAMVEALRASALARSVDNRAAGHEKVCAERYRWILLWIKATAGIVGISAIGVIAAMWQIIVKLSHLG